MSTPRLEHTPDTQKHTYTHTCIDAASFTGLHAPPSSPCWLEVGGAATLSNSTCCKKHKAAHTSSSLATALLQGAVPLLADERQLSTAGGGEEGKAWRTSCASKRAPSSKSAAVWCMCVCLCVCLHVCIRMCECVRVSEYGFRA
jgi:hypothetical protein